jgi:hypothetical protein
MILVLHIVGLLLVKVDDERRILVAGVHVEGLAIELLLHIY